MDLTQIPVEYVLKAAKAVKRIAYLIAAIGAAASYGTQVELLKGWDLGTFAYVIPTTIDLLAICAAIGLNIPGFPEKDQKYVQRVLIVAVLVSVTANMAGGHNWIARIAHAWPVVGYLLAEGIANRIRNFTAGVQGAQAAKSKPQEVEPPVHATASVMKTQPKAVGSKPGTAKAKILQLAAVAPPLSPEEIADRVGVKPGWVKHVVKTSTTA